MITFGFVKIIFLPHNVDSEQRRTTDDYYDWHRSTKQFNMSVKDQVENFHNVFSI